MYTISKNTRRHYRLIQVLLLSALLWWLIPQAMAGTLHWQWEAPTTNADGTPLTDLAGYRLYQGTSSGTYQQIDAVNWTVQTYHQALPPPAVALTLYSVVTAVDTSGNESGPSDEVQSLILPAPPPPLGIVTAADYGAIPDDGQPDTEALRHAVEAVNQAGGGVVVCGPGVWDVQNLPLTTNPDASLGALPLSQAPRHVTLVGTDRDATILRRIPQSQSENDQRRLMTVTDAEDFSIANLTLDMRGLARYGGAALYNCTRCTIAHTTVLDSTPQPLETNPSDRYAYVFGYGTQPNRDILIYDNEIRDGLQLEVDYAEGATIIGNTVITPQFTAGIGVFALRDDVTVRNIRILRNTIIDPRNAGIAVQLDFPTTAVNRRVEQVDIIGNTLVYTAERTTAPETVLRIGVGNNSIPTTGNVFAQVHVVDNTISVAATVPPSSTPLILANTSDISGVRFDNVIVAHNTLQSEGERPFVAVRRTQDSTLLAYHNTRVGTVIVQPPPTPSPPPDAAPLAVAAITARNFDAGNVPENTQDGDIATKWRAYGEQWIAYALAQESAVGAVAIAWDLGPGQHARFVVQVSMDGKTWSTVHSGQSQGQGPTLETYAFPAAATARHVRIIGRGTDVTKWNNIAEVMITGTVR